MQMFWLDKPSLSWRASQEGPQGWVLKVKRSLPGRNYSHIQQRFPATHSPQEVSELEPLVWREAHDPQPPDADLPRGSREGFRVGTSSLVLTYK